MPLRDSDFARVLNHLYLMSVDSPIDDESMAEALVRAAVVLLTAQGAPEDAESTARDMLERSIGWCQRMTPRHRFAKNRKGLSEGRGRG